MRVFIFLLILINLNRGHCENVKTNEDDVFIVNGETVVDEGEVPFQVAIFRRNVLGKYDYICGGSLVADRTVLTAGHCFNGLDRYPHLFQIRYASLDYRLGLRLDVIRITMHPAYRRHLYDKDLAILTLASPFEHSNKAQSIAIKRHGLLAHSSVLITGWGKLSEEGPVSNVLQKATLTVMDQDECRKHLEGKLLTEAMFCARQTRQSACKGDSGGPVIQNGQLVGVISWGSPHCLDKNFPNVLVRVSQFYDWIQINIA